MVRKPLCKYCGKSNKTTRQIYCSPKCYTDSGHRKAMGMKYNESKTNREAGKISQQQSE